MSNIDTKGQLVLISYEQVEGHDNVAEDEECDADYYIESDDDEKMRIENEDYEVFLPYQAAIFKQIRIAGRVSKLGKTGFRLRSKGCAIVRTRNKECALLIVSAPLSGGPNSERDSILAWIVYLRKNGAWERSVNRCVDLLSMSLWIIS